MFKSKENLKCAPYPNIYDVNYQNTYWQRFIPKSNLSFVTIDMFGAYYDDRPIVGQPVVRIISVINVASPNFKVSCQMWFQGADKAIVTKVSKYDIIWNQKYYLVKDGVYMGFLITCPVPKEMKTAPLAISLTNSDCERPSNNLRVQNNRPLEGFKKDFAVCVKGLDFPFDDDSISLVEFLEANSMFGVDKVIAYNLGVHPNVSKVLDYYIQQEKLEIHPYSMPANLPNEPYLRHMFIKNRHLIKILQELIPYNDCFYKNIHMYNYILVLDIDEIFVPNTGTNYKEMLMELKKIDKNTYSTYFARNKIFVKNSNDNTVHLNVPKHMEMLQITTVAENYERPYVVNVKSIFNTADLLTLNNHMPYDCVKTCKKKEIPNNIGQLNHYRKKCFYDNRNTCKSNDYKVVNDTSLWKFKEEFIRNTNLVLKELHLI